MQAYLPGAADLDLPVTEPARRRGPLDPGPPEPGRRGARSRDHRDPRGRDARRPGRGARACRPDRRGRRLMAAPLRVGLAGLGSMGRNHLRLLAAREGCVLAAVADPVADVLADAVAKTGAAGFADPLAMIEEAELDAVVIAAPTTTHAAARRSRRSTRGLPVLVEKPLAATVEEGLALVAAARAGGDPRPGRPRRALQPGRPRARPADREGLAGDDLLDHEPPRRARSRPGSATSASRSTSPPTTPTSCRWIAGERPTRVYAETAQRIHATHEDLLFGLLHFPSGATGMLDVNWLTPAKRRQLAVVGEAGMFELDYLTQRLTFTRADTGSPHDHRRLRDDVRGQRRRRRDRQPRAARRRARRVPGRGPRRRPPGRRRGRRAVGRRDRHEPPRRRRERPAGRPGRPSRPASAPMTITDRPSSSASLLGGSITLPEQPCVHEPARPVDAVDRRARDRRDRDGRRRRQDGPAAGRPVRVARLVGRRGRRQPRRRRRDQRRPVARGGGARSGRARRRRARGRPAPGDHRRRGRCSRLRRRRPHRPGDARRRAAAGLPAHGRRRRRGRARGAGRRHGHLRDDAAGRRHPQPVRAPPRGGDRPRRRARPLRRLLAGAALHRRGVPQPGDVPEARRAASARPPRTGPPGSTRPCSTPRSWR